MEEGKFKIYKLRDPRDNQVYYVGLTKNPDMRLYQHIYVDRHNAKKHAWIQDLRVTGLVPIMEIVDSRDNETEARRLEAQYVAREMLNKSPITNY